MKRAAKSPDLQETLYPVRSHGQDAFGVEALAQGRLIGVGEKDAALVVATLDFDNRKAVRVAAEFGLQAAGGAGVFAGVGEAVFHGQNIHFASQTPNIGLDGVAIDRNAACHN
jgi:hypothetical protein